MPDSGEELDTTALKSVVGIIKDIEYQVTSTIFFIFFYLFSSLSFFTFNPGPRCAWANHDSNSLAAQSLYKNLYIIVIQKNFVQLFKLVIKV